MFYKLQWELETISNILATERGDIYLWNDQRSTKALQFCIDCLKGYKLHFITISLPVPHSKILLYLNEENSAMAF